MRFAGDEVTAYPFSEIVFVENACVISTHQIEIYFLCLSNTVNHNSEMKGKGSLLSLCMYICMCLCQSGNHRIVLLLLKYDIRKVWKTGYNSRNEENSTSLFGRRGELPFMGSRYNFGYDVEPENNILWTFGGYGFLESEHGNFTSCLFIFTNGHPHEGLLGDLWSYSAVMEEWTYQGTEEKIVINRPGVYPEQSNGRPNFGVYPGARFDISFE